MFVLHLLLRAWQFCQALVSPATFVQLLNKAKCGGPLSTLTESYHSSDGDPVSRLVGFTKCGLYSSPLSVEPCTVFGSQTL